MRSISTYVYFKISWSVFLLSAFSCGDDTSSDNPSAGDPSNLVVQVSVSATEQGKVDITATADNATSYEFDMGDGSEPIVNTTGEVEYVYENANVFEVEIKAFGASGRFIRENRQIEIITEDAGAGFTSPMSYPGMTLIWQDEFTGAALNTAKWTFEIGDGCPGLCGWGNNELQYYLQNNVTVADGFLNITARQQAAGGRSYTSSRIKTQDKFEFTYGRVDIRARMPIGTGLWPALWLLGANIDEVGWPRCGEIDIMEMRGDEPNKTLSTIHWDNDGTKADTGGSTQLSSGTLNDEFHVYTMIWDETGIEFLLNDVKFYEVSTTPTNLEEFNLPFFFIFNVAVGGDFLNNPDGTAQFPQRMVVDYIRVFQDN